jgi:uncharacterized surface protein with fasciclin (FAS1) repeats
MFGRTSLLKATAVALPFSLAAAGAEAANIAETVQENQQLSTFAKAMDTAQFDQQLSGQGPYTVFAPSDQAFAQLPEGAFDELMKQENQAQLIKLLEHHVVQGQAIAADDVLGQQTQVDAMSGDTLTVDGTSQVVLLVPTGLTIAQVGDQLVIEREGMAVSTRAIQVQDQVVRQAGGEQQQPQVQQDQQTAAETPTAEGSDMPMTEHQQEVLKSEPGQEQQQTAPEGTAMPATEHQRQVLAEGEQQAQGQQQGQGQQEQQTAARTPTAEESDMPMTEHQQEVLKSEPQQEQQQTAPEGATAMPATEHQRQVLAEEELPGEQQQSHEQARVEGKPDILREATVVEAGIQADNGVIHVIDAVLVPQEVLKMLEAVKQGQG